MILAFVESMTKRCGEKEGESERFGGRDTRGERDAIRINSALK